MRTNPLMIPLLFCLGWFIGDMIKAAHPAPAIKQVVSCEKVCTPSDVPQCESAMKSNEVFLSTQGLACQKK